MQFSAGLLIESDIAFLVKLYFEQKKLSFPKNTYRNRKNYKNITKISEISQKSTVNKSFKL